MNNTLSLRFTLLFLSIFFIACQAQKGDYQNYFTGQTMRIDYFHHGTADEEHFSVDKILNDGLWSGSTTQLSDELNRGLYFFEVHDAESDKLIYSRGFCSIFGEWQTIPEAKTRWGTFHESVRIPWPKSAVKLVMKKRDSLNDFVAIWEKYIDPESRTVHKAEPVSRYKSWAYLENGDPAEKLDIVVLGDGYTAEEMPKFHEDIKRLMAELFKVEPFSSRKADFNVRAVETPAAQSGVSRPHDGIFKHSPLSVSYSAFDSRRYALSYDNEALRDAASEVPYDFMYLLINEKTYGGGGIYHLYASVAVDNKFSDYIFIHEFGHHIAGLGDEYYTSSVSYDLPPVTIEPWEPNVTAFLDADNLKWKDLVGKDIPLPTPWNKKEFDAFSIEIQKERARLRNAGAPEEELEALFERQKAGEIAMIEKMKYKDVAGLFEGSGYFSQGLYRSAIDCIMFSRNSNNFCPACQQAIDKVIDQYSR